MVFKSRVICASSWQRIRALFFGRTFTALMRSTRAWSGTLRYRFGLGAQARLDLLSQRIGYNHFRENFGRLG